MRMLVLTLNSIHCFFPSSIFCCVDRKCVYCFCNLKTKRKWVQLFARWHQVPCPLPCAGYIELLWAQLLRAPHPSSLRLHSRGPGPPHILQWMCMYVCVCCLRGCATTYHKASPYFKCGARIGVKRDFVPTILAGTHPELKVGDTEIIGGKNCRPLR